MAKKLIAACLILCSFILLADLAYAFEDEDFQLWTTGTLESALSKHWKAKVEQEFRFGDNASQHYYNHTDGSLTYKVNDNLYLGVAYRQIFEKIKGEWKYENRPHVNATVKFNLYGFELKNRSRWEYRMREDKDDTGRYRNKTTISYPFKWDKFKISPFVADEIFVDGGKSTWVLNRNRFYVGVKAKLLENLKAELFYLRQSSEKSREWTDYNVLGVQATVVF
ncbi:MAG: DUF2490 domain-containing protein [Candidatus Omnitrophota bacterium]